MRELEILGGQKAQRDVDTDFPKIKIAIVALAAEHNRDYGGISTGKSLQNAGQTKSLEITQNHSKSRKMPVFRWHPNRPLNALERPRGKVLSNCE